MKNLSSKQKYDYYFNICQNGYKGRKKHKSTLYANGFCDGYESIYPYSNNQSSLLTGISKGQYNLGYYAGIISRYPNYRKKR